MALSVIDAAGDVSGQMKNTGQLGQRRMSNSSRRMTTKGPETEIVISYEKRRNRGGGVDDHSYVFVCGRNMMCEVVCLLCMREITVANRSGGGGILQVPPKCQCDNAQKVTVTCYLRVVVLGGYQPKLAMKTMLGFG